jgi:hypothetical protein
MPDLKCDRQLVEKLHHLPYTHVRAGAPQPYLKERTGPDEQQRDE